MDEVTNPVQPVPMAKAYDLSALVQKLKNRGLDVAEDTAKGVFDDVCDWYEESAKLSPNPYDDIGLVILPKLKENAHKEFDKIDGKIG